MQNIKIFTYSIFKINIDSLLYINKFILDIIFI